MSYYDRKLGEASSSGLREFRVSPLQYRDWCLGADRKTTQPMRDGTALHMALQEPEKFARKYVVVPSVSLNSDAGKQSLIGECYSYIGQAPHYGSDIPKMKADELRERIAGDLSARGVFLVEQKTLDTFRSMVESLNLECHRAARSFVANGKKEVELRWTDPETGIACKARLDSWEAERGVLSDIKRTDDISARDFRRSVLDRGYHYQNAMYLRALRANGESSRYSCFVCGQPSPPYHWAVYDIDADDLREADEEISNNLRDLAECLATDIWPTINSGQPTTIRLRNR